MATESKVEADELPTSNESLPVRELTSTAEIEKLANQSQQYWNLAPELILKVVGIESNVRANKQGYPPTVNCTFYKARLMNGDGTVVELQAWWNQQKAIENALKVNGVYTFSKLQIFVVPEDRQKYNSGTHKQIVLSFGPQSGFEECQLAPIEIEAKTTGGGESDDGDGEGEDDYPCDDYMGFEEFCDGMMNDPEAMYRRFPCMPRDDYYDDQFYIDPNAFVLASSSAGNGGYGGYRRRHRGKSNAGVSTSSGRAGKASTSSGRGRGGKESTSSGRGGKASARGRGGNGKASTSQVKEEK